MPELPIFNAKPADRTISGGRRAAVEDFALPITGHATMKAAGDYLTDVEDKEARKALVQSSEIRAKYARELDAASLDGSDLGALKQKMQDDLAAVGEKFQTEKGAQNLRLYSANSDLMFDEQANKINVQRAYAEAKLDGHKFLNSAGALIQSNPAYLKEAEQNADALAATFRKIRSDQRAEIADGLKKELNMSAALGSARIDPEGTKKRLEAGEWDLTPHQRDLAISKADTEMRAERADETHKRALKHDDERQADEAASDKHFKGIMKGEPNMRRAIMDDPNLKRPTREHLIVFMEHRAKELNGQEKKSDPTVARDLWLRIQTGNNDPQKIFNSDEIFEAVKAQGRGEPGINTTDADKLMTLVANQKDENNRAIGMRMASTVSTVGHAISTDPQFIGQPALVASIQLDYGARIEDKIKEFREAKKSPNDLFNKASKDYVGSPAFIQESITAGREAQRLARPTFPDLRKTPDAWQSMNVGDVVIDPKGVQRTLTQATLDALRKSAPAAAASPRAAQYESFIKPVAKSASVTIDAPQRSLARKLQGQKFESREAAVAALEALQE